MGVYVKPKTKYYVLKYPNGKYAGMDQNSGGYPYETETLNDVNYWHESQLEKMKDYVSSFKELKVFEIELHTIEKEV